MLLLTLFKLLLTLKAARGAGGEGGAVSKDEAVLLLLQVGEPGAGRGLLTQLFAGHLACKIVKTNSKEKLTWCFKTYLVSARIKFLIHIASNIALVLRISVDIPL